MLRLNITLPAAIIVLVLWLGITLGVGWLETAGQQQSLAQAAGGHLGWAWLLAAIFVCVIAFTSADKQALGVGAPASWRSLRLLWLPLLYTALMLLVTWAGGFPASRLTLIIACNTAMVAVSEEFMFRGILLQGFQSRYKLMPAVLASSAIFGIVHALNGFSTGDVNGALWQSAAAALQGIAYAAIRLRTQSIWPMVIVHAVWDFSLMTSAISAATDGETSVLPAAALVAVLPLALYGLYFLRASQATQPTTMRT